ncbi:polyamine ABC transporter substrate-binding protein [Mycolicibacterium brisbanense]|uniref:Extracellular solute-binding protein n=1 Tax=Mycolicibacterium brisbanense TaxID=146020 RepID=A0A100W2T4_9MYCO|nr:spermidine/putrescine ABC transporter substrate-binding protein [Mycolicibacterium brisbanense]MCV7162814.1 spermidine/putrescine ABC transporter substrate-binding protein [Mycolicibacterium brisbanense]GAS90578.1 extracellular solute-binding protein [Mycolicibacterium brisbanense]
MTAAADPRERFQTSRRRFLLGGSAAAAALAFGSTALSACGSGSAPQPGATSAAPDDGTPASGTLRVSNWPLYIADGFVAAFQQATGLTVDYKENYNDDEEWFAKNKEPLSRRQDIGCDLVIPSETIDARLMRLGWLNEIRPERWPNKVNLQPTLLNAAIDPGRKYTAPYMSGLVGLAYNRKVTGRDIHTIDDLWDPKFAGKVSMLADAQDGLGMIMLSQGNSPAQPTSATVTKAIDVVREQKDKGQVRRFTGNDYSNDLAAGNLAVAQAYSGDVVQLQADNPDLKFVIPDAGGTMTLQSMVIPYTTQNHKAAEAWIDYVYDRANYAKLVAFTRYIPVLTDMTDALNKVDPTAAANPLINPPADVMARVKQWPALSDEQSKEYTSAYAAVTGS